VSGSEGNSSLAESAAPPSPVMVLFFLKARTQCGKFLEMCFEKGRFSTQKFVLECCHAFTLRPSLSGPLVFRRTEKP
jgi:hypothetical protein